MLLSETLLISETKIVYYVLPVAVFLFNFGLGGLFRIMPSTNDITKLDLYGLLEVTDTATKKEVGLSCR